MKPIVGKLYKIKSYEKAYLIPKSPDIKFMPKQTGYLLYIGFYSNKHHFICNEHIVCCDIYTLDKIEQV